MDQFLDILGGDEDEEDLEWALNSMQDVHEYDMQWVSWPKTLAEVRKNPYERGCFQVIRGIVRCIKDPRGRVRDAAVSLMLSLNVGGARVTRLPPQMAVTCGVVSGLCQVARDSGDADALTVIRRLACELPNEMIPALIDGGAIEASIAVLNDFTAPPLDHLAALDLILALAKRAPAKTAEAGAYDAVKIVHSAALVPRRNKIMNFLRPVVQGDSHGQAGTNIRIGGLKF